MKTTNKIKTIILALASAGLLSLPYLAHANPTGGHVVAGNATINQETATKIGITQATSKAIIDWQKYSIGANEHVQYYQPSASSVALNRVVGLDPSQILGKLTANGQVFLVNPNGIYFGRNAQVDVAGLVATTHNIRNEDFKAGRYDFNIPGKPGAAVINEGTIRITDTGIAAFVAPSVANRGVIAAKLGKVVFASANGFTLDFHGDELLTFLVNDEVAQTAFDLEGNRLNSFVENAGQIEAHGGYVLLTAKAAEKAIQGVVNQSGMIEASSVGQQNGEIVLAGGSHGEVINTGTLDASGKGAGETGGKVRITGEKVSLLAGTIIDVSGDQKGGTVIVGGDYLGGKASDAALGDLGIEREPSFIPTSAYTTMGQGTVINADAITTGKGGKVVLWSDELTQMHGSISANGGSQAGDGGFVETSSAKTLDITDARVTANAFSGEAGQWLLDPYNFVVDTAAAAAIRSSLNSGTNSRISATNEIDILTSIRKTSGGDATFSAYADFIYQIEGANITSTSGKLNVIYEAKDRIWIGRGWIGGESDLFTNGGNITFHGPNFVGVNGRIDAGAGWIRIKSENKNSTGIDRGIWIFGDTVLRGSSVSLITSDRLRLDPGTQIIKNVIDDNINGQLSAIDKLLSGITNYIPNKNLVFQGAEINSPLEGENMPSNKKSVPKTTPVDVSIPITTSLTGLALYYVETGLKVFSSVSSVAAERILKNPSLGVGFRNLLEYPNDVISLPSQLDLANNNVVLWNSFNKVAYTTGVSKQELAETLSSMAKIADAAVRISKVYGVAKDGAQLFSTANAVFVESKKLSLLELLSVIKAINNYSLNPKKAANEIYQNISILESYKEDLLSGSDSAKVYLALLRDYATDVLNTTVEGKKLIIQNIIISTYAKNNPGAISDQNFLNQLVEVPSDSWFGLVKTKDITVQEAVKLGYISL